LFREAWRELSSLSADDNSSFVVGALRVEILLALEKWELAAQLAEAIINQGAPIGVLYLSGGHAIRRARSLAEARAFLLRGEPLLENEWLWWYNLGCLECQMGDVEAAKARLLRTFDLQPDSRLIVIRDRDLEPLWDWAAKLGRMPRAKRQRRSPRSSR
jgi:tetratricopeptide (TPR) repeat protein